MEEKRITLDEIIEQYGLTLWATIKTEKGKTYQYMDFDGINVLINDWDKSFQLKWMVPRSSITLENPNCSPYDHPNHFDKHYKRFRDAVATYKCGLNNM
jgi:hypothetical protein